MDAMGSGRWLKSDSLLLLLLSVTRSDATAMLGKLTCFCCGILIIAVDIFSNHSFFGLVDVDFQHKTPIITYPHISSYPHILPPVFLVVTVTVSSKNFGKEGRKHRCLQQRVQGPLLRKNLHRHPAKRI